MAQCPPLPLNTLLTALHLFRNMIIIGKESTIAFSAIDKLVALFYNLEKAERKSDSTLVGVSILSGNQAKSIIMAYSEIWHHANLAL